MKTRRPSTRPRKRTQEGQTTGVQENGCINRLQEGSPSSKIIVETTSAFRGGGLGKRRKVWEGSQKSDGEEETVGGLGCWLLKGSLVFLGTNVHHYPWDGVCRARLFFYNAWQIAERTHSWS